MIKFCEIMLLSFFMLLDVFFKGTVVREEAGLTLKNARKEMLGSAVKVKITKDTTLIVTDGSTQWAVEKRVSQIRNLVEVNMYYLYTMRCIYILHMSK